MVGELDVAITSCLGAWAKLVRKADRLAARAVETAASGHPDQAIKIALEAEEALNEADALLTAVTLLGRERT